ncbi:MAG: hypothetical protein ACREID_04040, partial [Planctomycetota bacterium]
AEGRRRLEAAEAELEQSRTRLQEVGRLREQIQAAQLRWESAQAELRDTQGHLAETAAERDRLLVVARARDDSRAALAQAQARIKALQKDSDENIVLVCELRNQIGRIEKERDAAQERAAEKVKKILKKVHEELDAAGAPMAEEMSYGERIRLLHKRIATLEAALAQRAS